MCMGFIAVFSASVIGIDIPVTDTDQPCFATKRACYRYVIVQTPKALDELRAHFPMFPNVEFRFSGTCERAGVKTV